MTKGSNFKILFLQLIFSSLVLVPVQCRPIAISTLSSSKPSELSSQNTMGSKNYIMDPKYLYDYVDLDLILKTSLTPNPGLWKVSIREGTSSLFPGWIKKSLEQALEEVHQHGKIAAIPINTGDHWVGLVIKKGPGDQQPTFYFNDPTGTPIERHPNIRNAIISLSPLAQIKDYKLSQQSGQDCGPWTADNIIQMVRNQRLHFGNPKYGKTLRVIHAHLLEGYSQHVPYKDMI